MVFLNYLFYQKNVYVNYNGFQTMYVSYFWEFSFCGKQQQKKLRHMLCKAMKIASELKTAYSIILASICLSVTTLNSERCKVTSHNLILITNKFHASSMTSHHYSSSENETGITITNIVTGSFRFQHNLCGLARRCTCVLCAGAVRVERGETTAHAQRSENS